MNSTVTNNLQCIRSSLIKDEITPSSALGNLEAFLKRNSILNPIDPNVQLGAEIQSLFQPAAATAEFAMVVLNLGRDVYYSDDGYGHFRPISKEYVLSLINNVLKN